MLTKSKALFLNLLVILCWSLVPVIVRYTRDFFSVSFQNFFRYAISLLFIWPFFALSRRPPRTRSGFAFRPVLSCRPGLSGRPASPVRAHIPGLWYKLPVIAAANYSFQIGFTTGLFLVEPTLFVLIQKSGFIFSVILAALFFADERALLRHPGFLAGLLGAAGGVALIVLGGRDFGKLEFSFGVLLILSSALSWSLLSVLVKRWLPTVPTTFALSAVFTLVTPFFLLTHLISSGGWAIPTAPPLMWVLLAASGLIGIGIGHFLYYRSVPVLGVALAASLDLLRPFLVGVISFLLFRERLTPLQLAGGLLLLTCSYLVTRLRFRAER
jgi:drug/metabolite transporter (DMT)-like permease